MTDVLFTQEDTSTHHPIGGSTRSSSLMLTEHIKKWGLAKTDRGAQVLLLLLVGVAVVCALVIFTHGPSAKDGHAAIPVGAPITKP